MKQTGKFLLGFSLLIASVTVSAFNFKSSDFGMDDDDDFGDSWGSGPMRMSSGKWDTGPWGGGPFNTDTRSWGFTPWNWGGGRNNNWGGRNGPWGNSPWNWNNRSWGGNRGPWNGGVPGYGAPYYQAPYGGGYGSPYGNPYYGNPYYGQPDNAAPAMQNYPDSSGFSDNGLPEASSAPASEGEGQ